MARTSRPRRLATIVGVVLLALAAGGCGDDSSESEEPNASGPTSSSLVNTSPTVVATDATGSTTYLPAPDGVSLTAQGTDLGVGDPATVAWEPRQGLVGVVTVKVLALQKTSFANSFRGYQLDEDQQRATPYFVRARVTNAGDSELGGRQVPLYVVDGRNTLVEASSFADTFKPCPKGRLPQVFGPGASANVCMVYLSPDAGDLDAVSFRPTQDFDPITWTGTVTDLTAEKNNKGPKPNH